MRLAGVAIALLLAITLANSLAVHSLGEEPNKEKGVSKTVLTGWILVPAVISSLGRERGGLINVTVSIAYPGGGLIEINTQGYTGVSNSTRYSMTVALVTSSILSGIDWHTLDFKVNLGSQKKVTGSSGSFAVALLTYILLNPSLNVKPLQGYVVTGAIAPEGMASSVGKVGVKCSAANKAGYILVMPYSNLPDALENPTCRFLAVTDIVDAVARIYGLNLSAVDLSSLARYPESLASSMSRFAELMLEKASRNLDDLDSLLARNATQEVRNSVMDYIKRAREFWKEAMNEISVRPYTAASLAYGSYLYSLAALETARALTSADFIKYYEVRYNEIASKAKNLMKILENASKASTLGQLELLSTAATRLADSLMSLERSHAMLGSGDRKLVAELLAIADARILSAKTWLEAAISLDGGNASIPAGVVRRLANLSVELARLNVEYASSVLSESGLRGEARLLDSLLDKIQEAYSRHDWILAIGYSREAISRATQLIFEYSIEEINSTMREEVSKGYLDRMEILASLILSRMIAEGYNSPLIAAYLEYYEYLKNKGDYLSALRMLWSAIAAAEIDLTLYLKAPTPKAFQGSPPKSLPSEAGRGSLVDLVLVASATSIAAFTLGYIIAVRELLRHRVT